MNRPEAPVPEPGAPEIALSASYRLAIWRNRHSFAERARKQIGVAARRPDRHIGLGGGRRIDPHLAVVRAHLDRGDALVAAPLELLREADGAGKQRQPPLVLLAREVPGLGV